MLNREQKEMWSMLNHSRRAFLGGSLALACSTGSALAVPSGLEVTADLPIADREENRFLSQVREGNFSAVVRMLNETPARLYARDQSGQSAYLLAAYNGQAAVMELFEKKGA
jgi:ankyrin repeat protein